MQSCFWQFTNLDFFEERELQSLVEFLLADSGVFWTLGGELKQDIDMLHFILMIFTLKFRTQFFRIQKQKN